MTAATKDMPNTFRQGPCLSYGLVAAIKTYRASMLSLDASGNVHGFVLGEPFAGIQLDPKIDNSDGAAGAEIAREVLYGRFKMEVTVSGVTATHARNRSPVFAQDSATLSLRTGWLVGHVVQYVDVDTAIVEFDTCPDLYCLAETVAKADMTDVGTDGTKDFATSLPEGAVPSHTVFDVRTAFGGDTSATVQVGVAGNLNRFTAGTPSVFTVDVVGTVAPATSADDPYIAAAVAPRVTVTTGADFTNATAGATMDVKVFFKMPWRIA